MYIRVVLEFLFVFSVTRDVQTHSRENPAILAVHGVYYHNHMYTYTHRIHCSLKVWHTY